MKGPDIRKRAEIARSIMNGDVRLSLRPGSSAPEIKESSVIQGISEEIRNKTYGLPSHKKEY